MVPLRIPWARVRSTAWEDGAGVIRGGVMFSEIKRILRGREGASLDQLAFELGRPRDSVAAAVALLVERGRVRRVIDSATGATCNSACKSCPIAGACSLMHAERPGVEVFVWLQKEREVAR